MEKRILTMLQVTLFSIFLAVGSRAQTGSPALYMDPSQPIDARVDDLIHRMTLEQKASQVINQARAIPELKFRHMTGGARLCTEWREPERQRCFLNPSDWRQLLTIH